MGNDTRFTVISGKQIGYRIIILAFKVVHYDQRFLFFRESVFFLNLFDMRENNILKVLNRLFRVGPMIFRLSDMKAIWKFNLLQSTFSFPRVNKLHWEELPSSVAAKRSRDLPLIVQSFYWYVFPTFHMKGVFTRGYIGQWGLVNVYNQPLWDVMIVYSLCDTLLKGKLLFLQQQSRWCNFTGCPFPFNPTN